MLICRGATPSPLLSFYCWFSIALDPFRGLEVQIMGSAAELFLPVEG